MKTLTIRQIDDAVHEGLRVYAAKQGKSMEEVARTMLAEHFRPVKKPDFTLLEEIQKRVQASLPPGGPSAAEIVRQMRDEDNALVDAKWARIEADWVRAKEEEAGKKEERAKAEKRGA